MVAGSEKWHSISSNSGGDSTSYKQITKLNATAGTVVTIPINNTLTFIKPPVEILKFVQGTQNVTLNELTFDSGDGGKFTYDADKIKFDGSVKLKTSHTVNMTTPTSITDGTNSGYISESDTIDFSGYKNVEGVNTLWAM